MEDASEIAELLAHLEGLPKDDYKARFDRLADLSRYGVSPFWARGILIKRYAFAIPSDEALDALADVSPLVEMGAGTGYWAYLLRKRHVDVQALFLCWPDYATDFAANCLRCYTGNRIAYIGEGGGGCTGDDTFHARLAIDWHLEREVEIPQYLGLHDRLWIYRR